MSETVEAARGQRTRFEPEQLREFRAELQADPELAERILRELLAVPDADRVLIRTDGVSVDAAIMRALELTAEGVEARIEMEDQ